MRKITYIMTITIFIISFTVFVAAQESSTGETDTGRGQRFSGERRMLPENPEQMQRMMGERFKELLGLSDEEWTVLGPKILNVLSLSFQSRGNPVRMFMGRPGMQRPSPAGRRMTAGSQTNAVEESMQELQKLLEDKNTSTDKIKNQVVKVRKAREKMQQELATAQKELRELLTVRQEAVLISMGLLD